MDKQELIDRLNGNYPEYTQKPQHKKVQREGQLQIACVRWFRLQYPAFSTLLFHPKNEADGATSGKKLAINAASGVVPGVPDLILALPSMKDGKTGIIYENPEVYFGLGIELKYGKTNNQSANQKRFQGYWQCAGYKYASVVLSKISSKWSRLTCKQPKSTPSRKFAPITSSMMILSTTSKY